jgi:PncC family amidohydrolase
MNTNEIQSLIKLLIKKNLTLSTCESLTGGLFAAVLTEVPSAGKIFKGGFVVYSNEAKQKLVKISQSTLKEHGAISEQCAKEMAQNTQRILNSDLVISFTGNAGPSSQENKPTGLVFIALAIKENLISQFCQFSGSREEIRKQVIEIGIKMIKENLE